MINFCPKAKYDKDATVVLLTSGQTHPRFKNELDKGEIYPVLDGAKTFLFVGLGKTDKYVRDKVRRIYQAAEGKNAQGKIMGARPRGRPKKNREAIETSM